MHHATGIGRCRPLHQRASIGAVMRTVPHGVRRHQRLSSYRSSPITAPSGTLTPGEMIAVRTRAEGGTLDPAGVVHELLEQVLSRGQHQSQPGTEGV